MTFSLQTWKPEFQFIITCIFEFSPEFCFADKGQKSCFQIWSNICDWRILIKFLIFCFHCCVWCWKSTREYQISDAIATRIGNFIHPIQIMTGSRLGNFFEENFLVFSKNRNIIYDLKCGEIGGKVEIDS